jgi:hypothetical protein
MPTPTTQPALATVPQAGLQHVSVPEESAVNVAVTLPVSTLDLKRCLCTVIDMDDPDTCGIAPHIKEDAMPWLVTDPVPGYIAFPLGPATTTLRWGSPLFFERRRAIFEWTTEDDVVGVTVLTITVWSVAGMPVPPAECPTPPTPTLYKRLG